MNYVLLTNGVVTDRVGVNPTTVFPAGYAAQFAAAPDGVEAGWLLVDGEYVAPPVTREALKAQREAAVAAITVTTAAGNTFDGDEISQGRMARAVIALSTGLAPSVTWVLADNSVIQATAAELTEALVLAGQAQSQVWVIE